MGMIGEHPENPLIPRILIQTMAKQTSCIPCSASPPCSALLGGHQEQYGPDDSDNRGSVTPTSCGSYTLFLRIIEAGANLFRFRQRLEYWSS